MRVIFCQSKFAYSSAARLSRNKVRSSEMGSVTSFDGSTAFWQEAMLKAIISTKRISLIAKVDGKLIPTSYASRTPIRV